MGDLLVVLQYDIIEYHLDTCEGGREVITEHTQLSRWSAIYAQHKATELHICSLT